MRTDHCKGCRTNEAVVGYVTLCLLKAYLSSVYCHTGLWREACVVLENRGSPVDRAG